MRRALSGFSVLGFPKNCRRGDATFLSNFSSHPSLARTVRSWDEEGRSERERESFVGRHVWRGPARSSSPSRRGHARSASRERAQSFFSGLNAVVTLMGGMGWHAFSCMYCGRASASEADGPGGWRVDKRMENLLGKWTATRSGGDLKRAVRGSMARKTRGGPDRWGGGGSDRGDWPGRRWSDGRTARGLPVEQGTATFVPTGDGHLKTHSARGREIK